ncbi:MAG: molybdenum cofactor guanylyltransferase [Desulfobacterales bacterium]
MDRPCTGVILAGGLSTRYGGCNKALLRVGGRRILDRLFEVFRGLFAEIILVTNRPEEFLEWDALIVTDLFAVRSSLTGIHTGLFYARQPHAFFAACDTPFLQRGVIEAVLEGIEPSVDLVIPRTAAGLEPLCAAYSKRCLRAVEEHLRRGLFKIQGALAGKKIREIPEDALRRRDPELRSFFNVNTPEDLARAEALVAGETAEDGR